VLSTSKVGTYCLGFYFGKSRYNASGYNIVMYGEEGPVYTEKHYNGINTGNFLIRNCQWSMDLLDKWSSYGATQELRKNNEAMLNHLLSNRPPGWDADDQSFLVYVMITEREIWGSRIRLETDIAMSGYWEYFVPLMREETPKEQQQKPFVTHFAGCKPCNDPFNQVNVECLKYMVEAYNFADNQVMEKYGLRHVSLNSTELMQLSPAMSSEPSVSENLEGLDSNEGGPGDDTIEPFEDKKVDTSEQKKLVEKRDEFFSKETGKKSRQQEVDISELNPADHESMKMSSSFKSATYPGEQQSVDASEEKSEDSGGRSTTIRKVNLEPAE
jgi:hypothetical protein